MKLEDDSYCFVCGRLNPIGLRLNFSYFDNKISADFIPLKKYQGYKDIVHGGIISSILDEAMIHAAIAGGKHVLTAEISVRFKSPLFVNEKAVVEAEIIKSGKRLIEAAASLKKSDSQIIAEACGKLYIVDRI